MVSVRLVFAYLYSSPCCKDNNAPCCSSLKKLIQFNLVFLPLYISVLNVICFIFAGGKNGSGCSCS